MQEPTKLATSTEFLILCAMPDLLMKKHSKLPKGRAPPINCKKSSIINYILDLTCEPYLNLRLKPCIKGHKTLGFKVQGLVDPSFSWVESRFLNLKVGTLCSMGFMVGSKNQMQIQILLKPQNQPTFGSFYHHYHLRNLEVMYPFPK